MAAQAASFGEVQESLGPLRGPRDARECDQKNPNAHSYSGDTPLHRATDRGHIEIVKALIKCTDDPNPPNNRGETPIFKAAYYGHTEILKSLIECTDDPNAATFYGRTPYQTAIDHLIATQDYKHLETIKLLKPYI